MANQNSRRSARMKVLHKHPETPIFKGAICNTSFDNKSSENKRKTAWKGCPSSRRSNQD